MSALSSYSRQLGLFFWYSSVTALGEERSLVSVRRLQRSGRGWRKTRPRFVHYALHHLAIKFGPPLTWWTALIGRWVHEKLRGYVEKLDEPRRSITDRRSMHRIGFDHPFRRYGHIDCLFLQDSCLTWHACGRSTHLECAWNPEDMSPHLRSPSPSCVWIAKPPHIGIGLCASCC